MPISASSVDPVGQPLWAQVVQRITAEVGGGHWKAGEHLPSRRALAKQYGVALKTMNRAMAQLIRDGVLGSTSRIATFVPSRQATAAPASAAPASVLSAEPLSLAGRRVLVLAPLQKRTATKFASDPWTETILHQAEATASQLGGHLICVPVWPTDSVTFDRILAEALAKHRPDAVALVHLFAADDAWTQACARRLDILAIPCVLVSTVVTPATFPYLTCDQRHAGFYAARHLLSVGYERILFLDLGAAPWVSERLAGARDACHGACTAVRPADYADINRLQGDDHTLAQRAVAACLATAEGNGTLTWDGRTGVIAPADEFALLVLDQLDGRGLRAGCDLGVIGFDDLATGRHRGLTTIRLPLAAFGRELVDVLARGLAHGPELHQRRLTPELVARTSTARRPAGG